jgi:hypothetical protein
MKKVKKVLLSIPLVFFCVVKLHADSPVAQSNEVSVSQSDQSCAGQQQQENKTNELCQVEGQLGGESKDLQLQNIRSQLQKLNILEKEKNELTLLVDDLQKHINVIEKNMADFEHNIGKVSEEREHLCSILPDYKVIDDLQSRVSSLNDQFSSFECAFNALEDQVGCIEASPCASPCTSPCAYPCAPCPVQRCSCWSANVQYIAWTVTENYLDYAIQGVPLVTPAPGGIVGQLGRIETAKFEWRSGFKVGLQYNKCDRFEVELEYTYFHDHGQHNLTPSPNSFINATFDNLALFPTTVVKTKIAFDYNMAHLLLAKSILLTNCFALRAQAGLVGGVVTQDWAINYLSPTTLGSFGSTFCKSDWKFYGAGLKGGANFEWVLWRNLTLLSKLNLSLIYGAYKNRMNVLVRNSVFDSLADGIPYSNVNTHNFDHRFVTSLQFSLGPTYSWNWGSHECNVFAFYEINTLTNLQETYRSTTATLSSPKLSIYTPGFIALHGVTLGLDFKY